MYGTEMTNMMELFVQHFKDRTECFDDRFLCRKPATTEQETYHELGSNCLYYVHRNMNRIKFMIFLITDGSYVNRASYLKYRVLRRLSNTFLAI